MDGSKGVQQREGRFAYEGLDRVIHERARLSVLTSLIAHPRGLRFGDIKEFCRLTDGNLSRHLQVLQDAKLVEISSGLKAGDAVIVQGQQGLPDGADIAQTK